jgi:hypothetical protein
VIFPYVLPDGSFSCEKVCDTEECKRLLRTFKATCKEGEGLEKYLMRDAIIETRDHISTTYIVFDRVHEMCGYFTLKTAILPRFEQLPDEKDLDMSFDEGQKRESAIEYTDSAIELVNFARNGAFSNSTNCKEEIAAAMFYGFILDIVKAINEYVAVNYLIIHAIDEKLVKYYHDNYNFSECELNLSETENIRRHVRPVYDDGATFMALDLSDLYRSTAL